MTDQEEMLGLLGAKKRNRPPVNDRRKGKDKRGTKPATAPTVEQSTVAEQVATKEPAQPMMAIHTEAGVTEVPFNQENIEKIFMNKSEETQSTQPEQEQEMKSYEFPKVEDTFGNINCERTWKQIFEYVKGQVIGHPGSINEPFRALPRLLDTERDVSLRVYNFIDLVRHLGNTLFMADLQVEEGKTVLTFGFANEITVLEVLEVDDTVTFSFTFNENTHSGKILSQKVKSGHVMPEIALDTALVVLDTATRLFYSKLLAQDQVIELIRKEIEEMVP